MPIKFRCTKCGKLLGIATRKAGSEVNCPICSQKLVVPSPDDAPTPDKQKKSDKPATDKKSQSSTEKKESTAGATSDQEPPHATEEISLPPRPSAPSDIQDSPGEFDLSELVVYDDELPQQGVAATYLSGEKQPEPGEPVPLGMVLFPRRAYYVLAGLFFATTLIVFLAGYFIGQGNANQDLIVQAEEQARQRSFIEGKVYYNQNANERIGDLGSVVILIPQIGLTEVLKNKIPFDGLRPDDPPPPEEMPSIEALTKAGGLYTRVSKDGDFHLSVPDTGIYNLLIISRNTKRPGSEKNIDENDELSMDRYFRSVDTLIGSSKYRWQQLEVSLVMPPMEIEFGESGK